MNINRTVFLENNFILNWGNPVDKYIIHSFIHSPSTLWWTRLRSGCCHSRTPNASSWQQRSADGSRVKKKEGEPACGISSTWSVCACAVQPTQPECWAYVGYAVAVIQRYSFLLKFLSPGEWGNLRPHPWWYRWPLRWVTRKPPAAQYWYFDNCKSGDVPTGMATYSKERCSSLMGGERSSITQRRNYEASLITPSSLSWVSYRPATKTLLFDPSRFYWSCCDKSLYRKMSKTPLLRELWHIWSPDQTSGTIITHKLLCCVGGSLITPTQRLVTHLRRKPCSSTPSFYWTCCDESLYRKMS